MLSSLLISCYLYQTKRLSAVGVEGAYNILLYE